MIFSGKHYSRFGSAPLHYAKGAMRPPAVVARVATLLFLVLAIGTSGLSPVHAQSSDPHVYKVDEIHAGLPTPDRSINRETPQAAVESFLAAAAARDWQRAAFMLELTHLPEREQAQMGAELAQQFNTVIKRALLIDWATLIDRPDAVDVTASSNSPFAGQPRRSLRLAFIALPDRPVTVRIARLKIEGEDPVWVFPRQTVENIPALYDYFAPSGFERSLPHFLRGQAFWTLAWWEVLALPLILIAAAAIASIAHRLIDKTRQALPADSTTAAILDGIQKPAALLVFAAAFAVARRSLFTFSGAVNALIEPVVYAAIAIAIGALVARIIDALVERVSRADTTDVTQPDAEADRAFYTTLSGVRRFLLVMLLILGAGFVLVQSKVDQTLGFSLLASAGAIGIVLAFAAREALGNIMASLQIAFSKSARIGDAIIFEDELAYVEKIGFTHFRLRTWDGRRLMTPVSHFISETFENWTKTDPSMSKYAVLTLDHRADVDTLREEFEDFVAGEEDIIEPETAIVQVTGHQRGGMEVRFLFKAPDPSTAWNIHCRLREAMIAAAARLDETLPNVAVYLPRERDVVLHGHDERET